jgi:hypothetical protein
MPNWVITISDAEPPAAGIYRAMQKAGGTTVATHEFRGNNRRAGGRGFFIYTGDRAIDRMYPHVTVMLDGALFQRAGLLFFRSSTFHVSRSDSHKLFYETRDGVFQLEAGQGGVLGAETMKAMGNTFIAIARADLTGGITAATLATVGPLRATPQPPWVREALARQALEADQARLRGIVDIQNDEWARQFEWPDDL